MLKSYISPFMYCQCFIFYNKMFTFVFLYIHDLTIAQNDKNIFLKFELEFWTSKPLQNLPQTYGVRNLDKIMSRTFSHLCL